MEISNQKQIGGDNSQLVQIDKCIVQGISVKDVIEVFNVQFKNLLPELHQIAENKARERLELFENKFFS